LSNVVTGLSQNGDTVSLRAALTAEGFSLDHFQVISADDSAEPVAREIIGADLLTGDNATIVPGISGSRGTATHFFRNENLEERLSDLHIPDSEIENYAEALERGKTIVAYFARPENAAKVEELFRASELSNVRLF
jgi:hypothetical protein